MLLKFLMWHRDQGIRGSDSEAPDIVPPLKPQEFRSKVCDMPKPQDLYSVCCVVLKLWTFLVASAGLGTSKSRIGWTAVYTSEEAEGLSETNGRPFHLDWTPLKTAESIVEYPKDHHGVTFTSYGSVRFSCLALGPQKYDIRTNIPDRRPCAGNVQIVQDPQQKHLEGPCINSAGGPS